jgi:hypothetical protein
LLNYLRDAREIGQAQLDFQNKFESVGEKINVKVGHKGQGYDMEVSWLPSEGIWIGPRKLDNRYWNAFGVGQPKVLPSSNSIACEINFPFQGVNRKIAGIFAKDDQEIIWVLHRGKIGGGRTGVGPELFRNSFGGEWTSLEGDEVVKVGAIFSPDFIGLVSRFVKDVHRIKLNP